MQDMMRFASAALGDAAPNPVINAGFDVAQTPYACSANDPSLADCPAGTNRSALAWSIIQPDPSNSVPAVLVKNGGVPGYSTEVLLMPARHLAVVAFVNTRDTSDTGEATKDSETIARNILYGLLYNLPATRE
jgi:CubicO group peptidase (beta-lactamase class C family)